jgi:hypothetical protein
MFRRDQHDGDLAARLDHLMVDVLVADERERLDGLRSRLSPDFVYVGPDAVFDGADGLSEAFARYRHDRSLTAVLRRTSPVDQHHGWFRFTWARMERSRTAVEGWAIGSLDDAGAIRRLIVFEGLQPGQRAGRD